MENEIVKTANPSTEENLPAFSGSSRDSIIMYAIKTGAPVETLERLLSLQKEYDKIQAIKAFNRDLVQLKGELPLIKKTKLVKDFRLEYKFADLGDETAVITPILRRFGFGHNFITNNEGDLTVVTCVLRHNEGEMVTATLKHLPDHGPGRNNIKAMGSAVTYLKRYTLEAVLGLATTPDDDGGGGEPQEDIGEEPPKENAVEWIKWALVQTGTDIRAFCKYFDVDGVAKLSEEKREQAMNLLERKIKKDKRP